MKSRYSILSVVILNLVLLTACQDKTTIKKLAPEVVTPSGAYAECSSPRPEICTSEFRPVCAKVDTGVRCVTTTPCRSSENKTYSNACTACTSPKVYGFWKNACAE
jgi:hypothetical protein